MTRCPNCNAELATKPCPSCGWPDSTQPSSAEKRRVRRALAMLDSDEDAPSRGGCAMLAAVLTASLTLCFFKGGEAANWTSDGPGALIFYLGVAVFGLLTLFLVKGLLGFGDDE